MRITPTNFHEPFRPHWERIAHEFFTWKDATPTYRRTPLRLETALLACKDKYMKTSHHVRYWVRQGLIYTAANNKAFLKTPYHPAYKPLDFNIYSRKTSAAEVESILHVLSQATTLKNRYQIQVSVWAHDKQLTSVQELRAVQRDGFCVILNILYVRRRSDLALGGFLYD